MLTFVPDNQTDMRFIFVHIGTTIRLLTGAALAASLLLLTSCGADGRRATGAEPGSQQHMPASKGLPFEMVVIAPRLAYEGELADSVDMLLRCSTPVLPQHEPLFRLNVVWADGNLTPWRTYRSRLVLDIDPHAPAHSAIGVARNHVARPQLEIKVTARSTHELAQLLGLYKERLRNLLVDHELDCMAAELRRKYSLPTAKALKEVAGHTICVPPGLKASKRAPHFLWTGTNLNDKDQNFVFYAYDWDGRPLTLTTAVAKRDSALGVNIPGSRPDQWMQTARDAQTHRPLVVSRARVINKRYVHELHGLWEMRNGALGGAFVSLERIDTAARRVLVTEGFIYSPYSPKRNLLRQMEAALRTWQ